MSIKLSSTQATLVIDAAKRAVSKQRNDMIVGVGKLEAEEMVETILKIVLPPEIADAKCAPGPANILCDVPDCGSEASFIVNHRALCHEHCPHL